MQTAKKTLILAQLFISCMMAFLMTGLFSFIELGLTQTWLMTWLHHFAVAWPIAFLLSLVVGNLGFKMAIKLTQ